MIDKLYTVAVETVLPFILIFNTVSVAYNEQLLLYESLLKKIHIYIMILLAIPAFQKWAFKVTHRKFMNMPNNNNNISLFTNSVF